MLRAETAKALREVGERCGGGGCWGEVGVGADGGEVGGLGEGEGEGEGGEGGAAEVEGFDAPRGGAGPVVAEAAAAALCFRASVTAWRIGEVLGVRGVGAVGAAGVGVGGGVWDCVLAVVGVGDGARGMVFETIVLFPGLVGGAVDLVGSFGFRGEELAFGVEGLESGFWLGAVLDERFRVVVVVVEVVVDGGDAGMVSGMSEDVVGRI